MSQPNAELGELDARSHPLQRLHGLVSYLWWVPPFFACLPNWIPYLVLTFLLDRIRKVGFAAPYKGRFQVYWYVSLIAFAFGVRARSVSVETPVHRFVDLFVHVGVSFAAYYLIEDVIEIFRREQISRDQWTRVRRIVLVVLPLQVALNFLLVGYQLSDLRTSPQGFVGVLILLYVIAWAVLVVSLHVATLSSGPYLENRLQYGTIVPIEPHANRGQYQDPFQFSLMTLFFLMLVSACVIEYWNQPPRLDRVVVRKSTIDGYSLTMRVAEVARQPTLVIIERERSLQAPLPDSTATQYPRKHYLTVGGTKVWARRLPRMYLYDRDTGQFRRLKFSEQAYSDASDPTVSVANFWEMHVVRPFGYD